MAKHGTVSHVVPILPEPLCDVDDCNKAASYIVTFFDSSRFVHACREHLLEGGITVEQVDALDDLIATQKAQRHH